MAVNEMFAISKKMEGVTYTMSFYEIYGGRVLDLLNNQKRVQILEDGNNLVQIQGITERDARTPQEMQAIIDYGHQARTTHATVANNTSSRSHAICQIYITQNRKFKGKLILCDLAGSERAQDTQSNSRQRRLEGAKINQSLLALKECIRAMHSKLAHIPFRASKLTLALRDSFKSEGIKSKIVMVACVCPGSSSSDHTINTLRYADRLKMKQNKNIKPMSNQSKGGRQPSDGNLKRGVRESSPKFGGGGGARKRSKSRSKQQKRDGIPRYPSGQKDSVEEEKKSEKSGGKKSKSRSKNKWKDRKNLKMEKEKKRRKIASIRKTLLKTMIVKKWAKMEMMTKKRERSKESVVLRRISTS